MDIPFSMLSWTPSIISRTRKLFASHNNTNEELTNLAEGRPRIGTEKPIGRPCTATSRHVFDVGDEHAMSIRIVADQTHCWATSSTERKLVGSVNAHSRGAIDSCSVSISQSRRSVDILNMAACRIATSEEVEVVEKGSW